MKNNKGFTIYGPTALLAVVLIVVFCLVSGLCWQYTIHAWAGHVNKTVDIKFWQCILLGFVPVLGQASLPIAAATWLIMMFI